MASCTGKQTVLTLWIYILCASLQCNTLEPLYQTCPKAMALLFKLVSQDYCCMWLHLAVVFRRSGWVIHSWKRDEVNVHFGRKGGKLQLKFVLDTNQSGGECLIRQCCDQLVTFVEKYGKVQCQKVTEIRIDSKAKG